jgi:phage baseplate assembly protein W
MANRVLDLKNYFGVIDKDDAHLYTDIAAFDSLIYNSATPAYDYKAVRNAIRNILEFRLGQRPLNPTFGNTLYNFVYEPNTPETINRLINAIRNLLSGLDDRIIIHDIKANINDINIDMHEIYINISYSIKGLQNSSTEYSFSIA